MSYRTRLVPLAVPLLLAGCGGDGQDGGMQHSSSFLPQAAAPPAADGTKSAAAANAITLEVSMSAGGRVTAPSPQIDCADKCTETVGYGTTTVLTAVPNTGYKFVGWGGACTGLSTCSLNMVKSRQAYASFRPLMPGKPGPGNTGVPAGTTLTPSGPLYVTTPGVVIDGLDIDGCVTVLAKNVVIRRTRIRCASYYPVRIMDYGKLLIEDTEIQGLSGDTTSAVAFDNYTARRLNVHGSADGMKVGINNVIEDSWIHDLWLAPGDHADGIQSTGARNVVIRNNFIDIVERGKGHGGSPNSALQAGIENANNSNWVIEGNWFLGGGWVVHWDSGGGTKNVLRDNRFGRGVSPVSGQPYPEYGPLNWYGQGTFARNVWDDDGTPIPLE